MRKPFQGVWNIIRFNWHFYVVAIAFLCCLLLSENYLSLPTKPYLRIIELLILVPTLVSLCVSLYVYDLSGLYQLNWIDNRSQKHPMTIVNIHAGFDETSTLLASKFKKAELLVFDFYEPEKHTEISIKRARKAYPSFPNTKSVSTNHLPIADNTVDMVFIIFAAHEIRDEQERITFFKELKRIIKPTGTIVVTEHLRDFPNFLAYNIGFLHFYSRKSWLELFQKVSLSVKKEQKITTFISSFIITKNGIAS